MAESELAIVDRYRALHRATMQMLEFARLENWPALREAMRQQQEIVTKLQAAEPGLDWLSESARQDIATLLQLTESANKELADRADLWKNELSTILQNISSARVNVNKLARAYG